MRISLTVLFILTLVMGLSIHHLVRAGNRSSRGAALGRECSKNDDCESKTCEDDKCVSANWGDAQYVVRDVLGAIRDEIIEDW